MPWLVLSLGSRSSIPNLPEPSDALNPSLTECRATDNRFENRPRVLPIKHIGTLVGAVTMTEISPFSAAETARSVSAKLSHRDPDTFSLSWSMLPVSSG
jgi:hypothetical protein